MKQKLLRCKLQALLSVLLVFPGMFNLQAQVQLDNQLQFTGTGTSAEITGVQAVSNNHDAANKIYVDTSIANHSSSSLITHYIGEFYGGGIVVSVWDSAGVQHGLIADTTGDLSTSAVWCTSSYQSTAIGATAESQDNGKANTAAMMAQGGGAAQASGTAAYLCTHYTNGGFTDWYLPSFLELTDCYNAMRIVNNILGDPKSLSTNGLLSTYWSSTEYNGSGAFNDAFNYEAWGLYGNVGSKSSTYSVRAVRRY